MNQSEAGYTMHSAVESREPWLEHYLPDLDPTARRRCTHRVTGMIEPQSLLRNASAAGSVFRATPERQLRGLDERDWGSVIRLAEHTGIAQEQNDGVELRHLRPRGDHVAFSKAFGSGTAHADVQRCAGIDRVRKMDHQRPGSW